jgi:primosomal protein N' (replication factor Y)
MLVLQEEIQESYKPARYIRLQEQYNSNEGLSQLLDNLKKMLRSRKRLFYFQLTALDKKSIAVKKLVEKPIVVQRLLKH